MSVPCPCLAVVKAHCRTEGYCRYLYSARTLSYRKPSESIIFLHRIDHLSSLGTEAIFWWRRAVGLAGLLLSLPSPPKIYAYSCLLIRKSMEARVRSGSTCLLTTPQDGGVNLNESKSKRCSGSRVPKMGPCVDVTHPFKSLARTNGFDASRGLVPSFVDF